MKFLRKLVVSKKRTSLFIMGLLMSFFWASGSVADVVKPALVEISIYSHGESRTEIRASIEALLTGINGQYKNTKDAPTADEYDVLREMSPEDLAVAFAPFQDRMLKQVYLKYNGRVAAQSIESVEIPQRGYTKVPRISTIVLKGSVPVTATTVQWYYPAAFGDNAVRVRQVNEAKEQWHWSSHQWIRDDEPSQVFSLGEVFAKRPLAEVIVSYVVIGFEHIVPLGLDHILFILGIFLLSTRMRPLLWQVTMFTVAHTLTLGLAMAGLISLPANIVEPLIALSIAYVGVENIWAHSLHRSRLVLVFLFGLLHGLGFAGVLADFGMPDEAFIQALISFNVGVELGQLAVISAAFLLLGLWFREKVWYRQRVIIPGSLMIAVVGLYWTVERIQFS